MTRRLWSFAALCAATLAGTPASPAELVKSLPGITIRVDTNAALPGGLLVVRLFSSRAVGNARATFCGRRARFFRSRGIPRALVPVPVDLPEGRQVLGVEIHGRRARYVTLDVEIRARSFDLKPVPVSAAQQPLLRSAQAVRDSRHVLAALDTVSDTAFWQGRLQSPVRVSPIPSFGTIVPAEAGLPSLPSLVDGIFGAQHRGIDFEVPPGTIVQAPAAGRVVLAATSAVGGQTLVLDHGQGLLSLLAHLGRLEVREGDWVEGRTPIAVSGQSGIVATPLVHWGVYANGVAVDPLLVETLDF